MSTVLSEEVYVSPAIYLAREEASDRRHEYRAGVVQEMAGATRAHTEIVLNIATALRSQLRGKRCRAYALDIRVRAREAEPLFYYYSDVVVDCSGSLDNEIAKPAVIFEVLSRSTRDTDFGDKLANYLAHPSMRLYALVDQYRHHVTVYRRRETGAWPSEVLTGLEPTLELPEIGCRLPMAAIYEGVTLPPDEDGLG